MPASFDKPIICSACEAAFAVAALSEADYQILQELLDLEQYQADHARLSAFQALCQRNPVLEELIRPKPGPVPIQPSLSSELQCHIKEDLSAQDAMVLNAIGRYYYFRLRLRAVFLGIGEISERTEGKTVRCPECRDGCLRLDPTKWEDPGAISTCIELAAEEVVRIATEANCLDRRRD